MSTEKSDKKTDKGRLVLESSSLCVKIATRTTL